MLLPAKANAPFSLTTPQRLKLSIQNFRLENKEIQSIIETLQAEITKYSIPVNKDFNDDHVSIMSDADPRK